MLGYIILRAKEDKYIKNEDSAFIFRKGELYAANMQSNSFTDIKVFDERDNAIRYEYMRSCLRSGVHYTRDFEFIEQKEAINKKEFRKVREQLRIKKCNKTNDEVVEINEDIRQGLKDHLELNCLEGVPINELKMDFLCTLLDISTYDLNISKIIGNDIVEVLEIINNRQNFEYIIDDDNYKKFITICNFLEHANWVEWGMSIRGCWLKDELPTNGLYSMPDKIIFNNNQEVNNLISYLKSDEL